MTRTPLILDRLHVEASSRSRAETGFTIHAGHKKHWLDHDLPLMLFKKALAAIDAVAEVRFHGWGDPLANPDIMAMLAAARKKGATTVLVTDAGRLGDAQANALVRDGLDAVVFPLAGLSEETNFRRRGTSLYAVLAAIDRINTVRAVHETAAPEIRVRYTLTRTGLAAGELEQLPRFLEGLGVARAKLRPLSYATSPQTEYDVLVPKDQESFDAVAAAMRAATREAAQRGITLDCKLVHGGVARFHCPDDPGSSLFLAADGAISPCPLRNVPLPDPASYRFHGHDIPFPRDVRGNLHTTPLPAIWNAPDYRDFRYAHDTDTAPAGCAGCWRSFLVTVKAEGGVEEERHGQGQGKGTGEKEVKGEEASGGRGA
ncbi:SPASM domain-containing protein [Solidesulfovibrio alcoholivorans]|uniref:SPASM domain-containing protein n=1 Tax=Solidesulfovibrio alcoholivorans TaxID=81406 RepID=UPI000A02C084|nr:SPASM domain-containing protein [Solidesulfovibrio alcoholivorans]